MPPVSITGAVLDHVAHAVPRWADAWGRYAVDLGAEWNSGGPGTGFAPGQVRFGNRARVELLMPWDTGTNDFLERFLATSGPGAHHLTFKVPDFDAALANARSAGFEPVGVDRSDDEWFEAFLHPKQATGVVIQLAQSENAWESPAPPEYPTERRRLVDGTTATPASLDLVTHVVRDHDAATDLFVGLLDGTVVDRGSTGTLQWTVVRWSGPLGVRLVGPIDPTRLDAVTGWLGDRSGRVRHLELTVPEPTGVAGAHPITDPLALAGSAGIGVVDVAPADNLGLGLVLTPA